MIGVCLEILTAPLPQFSRESAEQNFTKPLKIVIFDRRTSKFNKKRTGHEPNTVYNLKSFMNDRREI